MQRILSYLAAIVIIMALGWGAWLITPHRSPQAATRFEAVPAGADGALKPCVVCHSIEAGGPLRVAPPLAGIVGAKKARADWYGYSVALRKAGGTWTEADLDKFLTAPSQFLPGTSKTIIGIRDAKERAEIIAALKKGS